MLIFPFQSPKLPFHVVNPGKIIYIFMFSSGAVNNLASKLHIILLRVYARRRGKGWRVLYISADQANEKIQTLLGLFPPFESRPGGTLVTLPRL